jgi:hypothetical protein
MRTTVLLLLGLALTTTGCMSMMVQAAHWASTTKPGPATLYVKRSPDGREELVLGCAWATADECRAMRPVVWTNDSADEEAWVFETRPEVRAAVGIPYGRMPQDLTVIGARQTCETARAELVRAHPDVPTEPCRGPYFFRRPPIETTPEPEAYR